MNEKEFKKVNEAKKEKYVSTFLCSKTKNNDTAIYVEHGLHKKIKFLLNNMGMSNITMSSYVNNILMDHFEKNKDIIEAMCKENFEKVLYNK